LRTTGAGVLTGVGVGATAVGTLVGLGTTVGVGAAERQAIRALVLRSRRTIPFRIRIDPSSLPEHRRPGIRQPRRLYHTALSESLTVTANGHWGVLP
jgi:hypothetical protein